MGALTFDEITACLITRGDTDMQPILDTLPYGEVLVWDRDRQDVGVYGRYLLVREASNPVVYLQDDDVIFRHHAELLAAFEPGLMVANWPHGDTPAGFDDCALMHAGALVERDLLLAGIAKYLKHWPPDLDFRRDCDMAAGILTPHKYVHLPHEILPLASQPTRMCRQPWQRETKMRVANRARAIRDHCSGQASRTDSMLVQW